MPRKTGWRLREPGKRSSIPRVTWSVFVGANDYSPLRPRVACIQFAQPPCAVARKHLVSMRTSALSACAQAPCQHAHKRLVSMRASTLCGSVQAPCTVAYTRLVSMRTSTLYSSVQAPCQHAYKHQRISRRTCCAPQVPNRFPVGAWFAIYFCVAISLRKSVIEIGLLLPRLLRKGAVNQRLYHNESYAINNRPRRTGWMLHRRNGHEHQGANE